MLTAATDRQESHNFLAEVARQLLPRFLPEAPSLLTSCKRHKLPCPASPASSGPIETACCLWRRLRARRGVDPGSLETASGVAPLVIGKPQPDLIQMILEVLGSDPDMTFMRGDRIESDIIAG